MNACNMQDVETSQLIRANERRSTVGAKAQCAEATKAIRLLHAHPPHPQASSPYAKRLYAHYLGVLQTRVDNPRSTLAEVAAMCGQTKNIYWSHLRRAFSYANQL